MSGCFDNRNVSAVADCFLPIFDRVGLASIDPAGKQCKKERQRPNVEASPSHDTAADDSSFTEPEARDHRVFDLQEVAMSKPHIAILGGTATGHVYSALGFSTELAKRGYRVTFATTEDHADAVQLAGAELVPLRKYAQVANSVEPTYAFDLPPEGHEWWQKIAPKLYSAICDYATLMLPDLAGFYEKNVPDLILYDRLFFAGRILAHRLCVPAVRFFGGFAFYKNFVIRENGVCLNPEPVFEIAKRIDEFFFSHGIKEENNLWHTERLNIQLIPAEFQYHADSFDSRTCFVGVGIKRPFRPAWVNRSDGKPIILVSNVDGFPNIRYFRVVLEAFANSEYYVILSPSGKYITDERIGALPQNFEISRNVSHLEILPHTALAISQGGTGNTLYPIYHGVPVVAVPMFQPGNHQVAYRAAELGLGAHLPGAAFAVDTIRECVSKTLGDSAILSRVKATQQVFQRYGGAQLAVDHIERFLKSGA